MSQESAPRVDVSDRPTPRRLHRPLAPVRWALFKPDRPRRIDRYIDYFGGAAGRDAAARTPSGDSAGAARDHAAPGTAGADPARGARVGRVRPGRRACPARVGR